jgi:hypothetical protein
MVEGPAAHRAAPAPVVGVYQYAPMLKSFRRLASLVEGRYGVVSVVSGDGNDGSIGDRIERRRPQIQNALPWAIVDEENARQRDQVADHGCELVAWNAIRALQDVHGLEDDELQDDRRQLPSAALSRAFSRCRAAF